MRQSGWSVRGSFPPYRYHSNLNAGPSPSQQIRLTSHLLNEARKKEMPHCPSLLCHHSPGPSDFLPPTLVPRIRDQGLETDTSPLSQSQVFP